MIGAVHSRKGNHGHVTRDVLVSDAPLLVLGVGRCLFHVFFVTMASARERSSATMKITSNRSVRRTQTHPSMVG